MLAAVDGRAVVDIRSIGWRIAEILVILRLRGCVIGRLEVLLGRWQDNGQAICLSRLHLIPLPDYLQKLVDESLRNVHLLSEQKHEQQQLSRLHPLGLAAREFLVRREAGLPEVLEGAHGVGKPLDHQQKSYDIFIGVDRLLYYLDLVPLLLAASLVYLHLSHKLDSVLAVGLERGKVVSKLAAFGRNPDEGLGLEVLSRVDGLPVVLNRHKASKEQRGEKNASFSPRPSASLPVWPTRER